jgi:hypothetical protein
MREAERGPRARALTPQFRTQEHGRWFDRFDAGSHLSDGRGNSRTEQSNEPPSEDESDASGAGLDLGPRSRATRTQGGDESGPRLLAIRP